LGRYIIKIVVYWQVWHALAYGKSGVADVAVEKGSVEGES
jgi:hypothetical protein